MSEISPKARLLATLHREVVDRPPVMYTGEMMNAAIVDVMNESGTVLPAAHHDPDLMASLAAAIYNLTGFENFGIPFCMTVEAEVLGSAINFGTLECEPKIDREAFTSVSTVEYTDRSTWRYAGRVPVVAHAVQLLAE
ncbi:MAG TPA: uroporphyrinogen decarboxylase family protein, partial [Armatimonadota bacterium]|nr:uroporphyrinogen decarboxylase family protein [Armatimonadota bacterium]